MLKCTLKNKSLKSQFNLETGFNQFFYIFLELENGAEFVPLDMLLQQSDFVIVTCSLTPETENLFKLEKFKKMKKSAIFVNTSRGGKGLFINRALEIKGRHH